MHFIINQSNRGIVEKKKRKHVKTQVTLLLCSGLFPEGELSGLFRTDWAFPLVEIPSGQMREVQTQTRKTTCESRRVIQPSELKLENPPIRNQFPELICGFERLGSMRGRKGIPLACMEAKGGRREMKANHRSKGVIITWQRFSLSFSLLYSFYF